MKKKSFIFQFLNDKYYHSLPYLLLYCNDPFVCVYQIVTGIKEYERVRWIFAKENEQHADTGRVN